MSPAYRMPCCEEMPDRVSELLDGELDDAARTRVALHLAGCAPCARLAAELAATVEALHHLSRSTVPRPGTA